MNDKDDDFESIRNALKRTGSRLLKAWSLEVWHVYPLDDLREHNTDGSQCWCNPTHDGDTIVHNSMDGRELLENGRKPN